MPSNTKERRRLLAATESRRREAIDIARDYMARTGLNARDFARRVGYSRAALHNFLAGRYWRISGDDSHICAAITEYVSTNPIEPLTEVDGSLHETQNTRLVRRAFYEALDNRRAYYFRGAPGSQKTFTLLHLIAELNRSDLTKNGDGRRAFYVRCRIGIKPTQLMKRVAEAAGTPLTGDVDRILRNLRLDLGKRKSLFVFDEAQHLDVYCLETLRELHDMPPRSGMLFAGSHEIETTFSRLDMEQWHSRLRQGAELPGISEDEAAQIIRAELGDKANASLLIRQSYATDLRKGREVKYISARTLFWAIELIKERRGNISEGANSNTTQKE